MFKGLTGENQTIGGADDPRFGDSVARSLNKVGEQVNQAARAFAENFGDPFQDDTHNRYFWARIYGKYDKAGVGKGYQFQIITHDAEGKPFYQNSDEIYDRLFDVGGNTGLMVGQYVMCMRTDDDSGMYRFYILPAIPHALFPVVLVRDDALGNAGLGSATAYPSMTYTLKTWDSAYTLATAKAPQRPRLMKAQHIAATAGTAFYTAAGVITLAEAWEQITTDTCYEA